MLFDINDGRDKLLYDELFFPFLNNFIVFSFKLLLKKLLSD